MEEYATTESGEDALPRIVSDISLRLIPANIRAIFYWLILSVTVVSLIGNTLAIRSILIRKCKYLQKCCIISLALADIISIIFYSINMLSTLSQELMTWDIGEFLCYFIPMAQVFGTTASSISLLVIAIDRYRNVIHAMGKKWDPSWWKCLIVAVFMWIVCAAISYPMYTYYFYIEVEIVFVNAPAPYVQKDFLCVSTNAMKQQIMSYYVTMAAIVFIPIVIVFICFYYKIAALVWRHRKPINQRKGYNSNDSEDLENSTSYKSNSEIVDRNNLKSIMKKSRNVQVERKIRTFKIVVTLMLSFVCCRLPYWTFFVIRLVYTLTGSSAWNIHLSFLTLNMLNCALNPFLYTFLNQSILVLKKLNDFMCKICCCCFSDAEFEDFEKENPFATVRDPPQIVMERLKSPKHSRVKFVSTKQAQKY